MVSPVTICTPAAFAAVAALVTKRRSVSVGSPSSIMSEKLRYSGFAPHMARSLTVPHTASLPMSPPGNSSGVTTKLSLEKARFPSSSAPSPKAHSASFLNAGTIISSISAEVLRPPEP